MSKEIKDNVILSIQNASYQYSDATSDEYAIKNINYDFENDKLNSIALRFNKHVNAQPTLHINIKHIIGPIICI